MPRWGALDVVIRVLEQAQDDVLDVFAHVARLGQSRGIGDGERHVQNMRQRASEQSLAGAGGAEHENVALLNLDLGVAIQGMVSSVSPSPGVGGGSWRMRL